MKDIFKNLENYSEKNSELKINISLTFALFTCVTMLVLLAISGCAWSTITPDLAVNKSIVATNSRCHGITLTRHGRYLHIESGSVQFDDGEVKTAAQTLEIPYCAPLQIQSEKFKLFSADANHPYFTRVPLGCLAGGAHVGGPVGFIIMPDSLVLERSDGKLLNDDKDYKWESRFDSIERLPTAATHEGEVVKLHYKLERKRIDTLIVDKSGRFHVIQGTLSQFAPIPAQAPASTLAIAHVLAASECEPLTDEMIAPISDLKLGNQSSNLRALNEKALLVVQAKLKSKTNLNLLFCGDSVCCGAFASSEQKSYPELFRKLLSQKTGASIKMIKLCIGGKTSSDLLPSIKRHLLSRRPDLMVIEFVNDLSLPASQIEKNYSELFACAKESGTEVIVCIPHLPSPLFYGQPWQKIADKPFFHIVPTLASKSNCAIADVSYRWLHADDEGMQPIWMLADQANHPNDYGHQIYAQELMRTLNLL